MSPIVDNNFPNPIPPGGSSVGLIPTGTGILNVGGDRVLVRHNVITGNDSLGLAIIGNFFAPLDPRMEPFVDENEVRRNAITGNGSSPDPLRAITPGVDIVFESGIINPFTGMLAVPDPYQRLVRQLAEVEIG